MIVSNQHAEPSSSTSPQDERAWLEGLYKRMQRILSEITTGYPLLATPDVIEDAISDGESMADSIWRQMCRLDDAEAEE